MLAAARVCWPFVFSDSVCLWSSHIILVLITHCCRCPSPTVWGPALWTIPRNRSAFKKPKTCTHTA